jgi:hypothetical protein
LRLGLRGGQRGIGEVGRGRRWRDEWSISLAATVVVGEGLGGRDAGGAPRSVDLGRGRRGLGVGLRSHGRGRAIHAGRRGGRGRRLRVGPLAAVHVAALWRVGRGRDRALARCVALDAGRWGYRAGGLRGRGGSQGSGGGCRSRGGTGRLGVLATIVIGRRRGGGLLLIAAVAAAVLGEGDGRAGDERQGEAREDDRMNRSHLEILRPREERTPNGTRASVKCSREIQRRRPYRTPILRGRFAWVGRVWAALGPGTMVRVWSCPPARWPGVG